MYEITEIASMTSPSAGTGRVFFCIYYVNSTTVPDAAFQRAARSWIAAVKTQEGFNSSRDIFMEHPVKTEPEFKTAWNGVASQATLNKMPVWAGNVLSHSSKDSGEDGLEFSAVAGDGTITQADIAGLAKMPCPNGYLVLSGCNTGVTGTRTWAPSKEFAKAQKIRVLGQAGYAYFSKVWSSYSVTKSSDSNIALWAYKRGKNGATGNGSRMTGVISTP